MLSLHGLKQLVAPERVVAVAPEGSARPDWARLVERNLVADARFGPVLILPQGGPGAGARAGSLLGPRRGDDGRA